MSSIKRLLRSAHFAFQKTISRSSGLSSAYLNTTGALLKSMPHSVNYPFFSNAQSVEWPNLQFRPKRVIVKGIPLDIIPHPGEPDFAALFMKHLPWEEEVFEFLYERIPTYDAIVEVGANVGFFTTFFSRVMKGSGKSAPIFTFEPSRKAYLRLLSNLANNQADNVYPFNCAMSNQTEFTNFFEPEGHTMNGSLSSDFAGTFSQQVKANPVLAVSGTMLQDLLAPYKRVLFKIDVEGAEALVLASLKDLILSKQVDLIIEVLNVTEMETDLNNLDFILDNFRLSNITKDGLIPKDRFEANFDHRDYFLTKK